MILPKQIRLHKHILPRSQFNRLLLHHFLLLLIIRHQFILLNLLLRLFMKFLRWLIHKFAFQRHVRNSLYNIHNFLSLLLVVINYITLQKAFKLLLLRKLNQLAQIIHPPLLQLHHNIFH